MKNLLLLLFALGLTWVSQANNISITNVSLTGQNISAGANNGANFTQIQFTVSWDNSHRLGFGPANWDAAWIFFKYRVNGGAWSRASLSNTGHVAPTGSTISTGLLNMGAFYNISSNPGVGIFIHRSATGTGTFTCTNTQVRWNYGSNGVADNAVVEIQAHATEMVYVPQAAFNVGGGGGTNSFSSTTISTATSTTAPTGTGILGGATGGFPSGQTAPGSASWPNGFNAYYAMKYEISQQQYVDFLNSLTTSQATLRFNGVSALYRYGISVSAGVYTTSLPNVAAGYLSWADLAAYLDWSGLRPLTDMEFEKTCRGNLPAVAGEYAWGTTTISGATGISNSGLVNEIASNSGANAAYNNVAGVAGPMRVGCFAGATTTRAQAGATYYGAMEMSGNLWERAINLSSTDGKAFTGNHGDGNLATTGDHNVSSWPSSTSTNGVRLKGGSFSNASNFLNISDRTDFGDAANRSFNAGGRGGRTAP